MADEQFYTILTTKGKAKIANASLLGSHVILKTLKVGDSNGSYYNPTEEQADLINIKYTCDVGSVQIDAKNPNWIIAETVIPSNVGGFTIRELGIFDTDGDMIAVGKYPETYKPQLASGAGKDLCIRTIFEVSNTDSVTLSLDPSVIIATRDDINNLQEQINENRASLEEKTNKSELDKYYSLYDAINIASNTDLNDIKDIGNYLCKNVTIASTLINSPFNSAGFTLKNERCTDDIKGYIRQTIITNSSASRTFVRNFVTSASTLEGKWSEWHEIAYKEDNDVLFEGTVGLEGSTITLSESISNYKFLMMYTSARGLGCEIMQTDLENSYIIRQLDIQNSATTRVVTFYELGFNKTSDKELTVVVSYKMEDANGVYTKEEGTADKNVNDFLRIYKIVGVK